MYKVNITNAAEEEISSTVTYIADSLKAPKAADHLLTEIEKYEELLETNPHIYPLVPDEYLAERGIRYVLVKNYIVFFVIDEKDKTVNVFRFLYGRRDWKNILQLNTVN